MSSRQRILVIDDDPLFRGLLVSLLRNEFLVMVAKDGAEGFYRAVETRPDIAIIDVRMPGWDGIRTLKALREHRGTSGCKVVMLTGDASRETITSAIRAGADDYLIKTSFTNTELVEKITALTRGSGASQAERTPAEPASDLPNGTLLDSTHSDGERAEIVPSLQAVIDGWD